MTANKAFLQKFLDREIYMIPEESNSPEYVDGDIKESILQDYEVPYSGKNLKEVIVIIDEEINSEQTEFLENILNSINLTYDDIALVKINEEFHSNADKLRNLRSRVILSFGITSGKSDLLDIQSRYSPSTINNKTVIISDSLAELEQNKDLKRKLWTCLKEVFK